jgi:poly(A) polymerase
MQTINKARIALQIIAEAIQGTEWERQVFVVGGYVRDDLIGDPKKDIDLVITIQDGGIKFAEWVCQHFGVRGPGNPVIFPRFGTAKFNLRGVSKMVRDGQGSVRVDISDVDFEAVMPRSEQYTAGSRKPVVAFGSLVEDAERRDFTINSLMRCVSTGQLLDFTGTGLRDLKDSVIRSAIDPDVIFTEDPLRMLRAVRFTVRFNGKLPLSMIKSLRRNAAQLANISHERIQDELNKMLVTAHPAKALRLLQLTGLLDYALPELTHGVGMLQNHYHKDDVFRHILAVVEGTPAVLDARLGAMFHDIGKPVSRTVDENGKVHFHGHEEKGAEITQRAMSRLRYSNEMVERISKVVALHMRVKKSGEYGELVTDKALRKLRRDAGEDLDLLLTVMDADNRAHAPGHDLPHQIDSIRKRFDALKAETVKPNLPINGNDVLDAFQNQRKAGPWVKEIMAAVEEAWLENPDMTRDDALTIVANFVLAFDYNV